MECIWKCTWNVHGMYHVYSPDIHSGRMYIPVIYIRTGCTFSRYKFKQDVHSRDAHSGKVQVGEQCNGGWLKRPWSRRKILF